MLLLALGVCSWASPAWAEKIIDTFDTTTQTITRTAVGTTTANAAAPEAIGGQRDLALTVTTMADSNHTLSTNAAASGVAKYFETNGNGFFAFTWDGDSDPDVLDPTGLGGMDLTQGGVNTGILVRLTSDLETDLTFEIYTNANDFSTLTLPIPAGIVAYQDFFFDFASFTPTNAGANFASVGAIVLRNSVSVFGNDVGIDLVAAVPEPHSVLLLAIGGLGLVLGWRRRGRV
jgi:hypothetical protein